MCPPRRASEKMKAEDTAKPLREGIEPETPAWLVKQNRFYLGENPI